MKNKEIKQTNFRTWKSGKTWIYSSTVIAALAGGAATVSKVKADSVTDPQITALTKDAQQQAQTQQVQAEMAGVSTTPQTSAETPVATTPQATTDTPTQVATSSAAVSQTLAAATSASTASLSPESAAMQVASYAAEYAPSLSAAVASAKAAGDNSGAAVLGQIEELLTNVSSAAAVSPSAAATYLSSVTAALSSAANNPSFASVTAQVSSAMSTAEAQSAASQYSNAASEVAQAVSNASLMSSVAATQGDSGVESMLASQMASLSQTASGKAKLQSLASSFAAAVTGESMTSLQATVASTAASDATALATTYAATHNSSAADASAVANVMNLWEAAVANPTSATAAALQAAKSALTVSQNALASMLMTQVSDELKAKGISISAASMSLASVGDVTTGSNNGTDAINSNINLLQALAIPVVPIILGVACADVTGNIAAFLGQALLGIAANVGTDLSLAIPNMMPVVDWFFEAVEPIGIGAFTGTIGGAIMGIGTAVITGAPFGYAAGAEVDISTIAPILGIDVSDSTQGQANKNMISNILLLAAIGGSMGGTLGALMGGTVTVMIPELIAGGVGLALGALSTIPFIGAVLLPITNALTTVILPLDEIGGTIVGDIGAVIGAEAGGIIGYTLTTTGVMSQLYDLIGGMLNSVLSTTNITIGGGGEDSTPKGAIAVQSNVTVGKGTSFSPLSLVQSVKDSAGNNIPATNLTIVGNVPTKVPGVYNVVYSFQDPQTGATVSQVATVTVGATLANMSLDQANASTEVSVPSLAFA